MHDTFLSRDIDRAGYVEGKVHDADLKGNEDLPLGRPVLGILQSRQRLLFRIGIIVIVTSESSAPYQSTSVDVSAPFSAFPVGRSDVVPSVPSCDNLFAVAFADNAASHLVGSTSSGYFSTLLRVRRRTRCPNSVSRNADAIFSCLWGTDGAMTVVLSSQKSATVACQDALETTRHECIHCHSWLTGFRWS